MTPTEIKTKLEQIASKYDTTANVHESKAWCVVAITTANGITIRQEASSIEEAIMSFKKEQFKDAINRSLEEAMALHLFPENQNLWAKRYKQWGYAAWDVAKEMQEIMKAA